MSQELRTVSHFEQAVTVLSKEQTTKNAVLGPDPQAHIDGIRKFVDAGYDYVYVHQVGPQQEAFMRFYQQEVLPELNTS